MNGEGSVPVDLRVTRAAYDIAAGSDLRPGCHVPYNRSVGTGQPGRQDCRWLRLGMRGQSAIPPTPLSCMFCETGSAHMCEGIPSRATSCCMCEPPTSVRAIPRPPCVWAACCTHLTLSVPARMPSRDPLRRVLTFTNPSFFLPEVSEEPQGYALGPGRRQSHWPMQPGWFQEQPSGASWAYSISCLVQTLVSHPPSHRNAHNRGRKDGGRECPVASQRR